MNKPLKVWSGELEKLVKAQRRKERIKKTLAVVSGLAIAITLAYSHNRELKINKEA